MTIETIYNELKDIIFEDGYDVIKYARLKENMEKEIRKNNSYKTSSKTRVNAILKVASKDDTRPVLTGYGVYEDYKVVTDSYHLIAIKDEVLPLPLVTSDLEEAKEHKKLYGDSSVVMGTYPSLKNIIDFNLLDKEYLETQLKNGDYEELTIDVDDLTSFIAMNKKDKKAIYKVGENNYNARFLKDIIDVIGKEAKLYTRGGITPLYFINDKKEIGLALPIRNY